jgi:hypothetical protein
MIAVYSALMGGVQVHDASMLVQLGGVVVTLGNFMNT